MARLMRQAQTDAARMAFAERARTEGDIQGACRLYLRVAGSRPATPFTAAARQRLVELQNEARQTAADTQRRLEGLVENTPIEQATAESLRELAACLAKFDELAKQYERVPQAGREIRVALAKHKKHSSVQAALREPDARKLWEDAQELEQQGHLCCAFLLYEEAVRELPAPSAVAAQRRLAQLKLDPQNIADAEACRNLQWCHERYRLAERVARVEPQQARELFEQIVARAPADSKIYDEAREQITRLSDGASSGI